jgi:hypothetical protein
MTLMAKKRKELNGASGKYDILLERSTKQREVR